MNNPQAKLAYWENLVDGASPIGLVVILYDRAIRDMRNALNAMKANDIEARTTHVNHALLILEQLQGRLDFARGGEAARQFERFYNVTRAKPLEAQMRQSTAILEEQIRHMSEVRACWSEAEKKMNVEQAEPGLARPQFLGVGMDGEEGVTAEWSV